MLFGFSINALTLFGLVLAIGIVVDDAIVVVENVERNIEQRAVAARRRPIRRCSEVTGPIIAIALVLIAVFVPLAFITGLTGQFYKQFALTIAISTVISAFNSLTLSPALAALLLKAHDAPKDALTRGMDRVLGWFFRGFNRVFHRGSEAYGARRRTGDLAQGDRDGRLCRADRRHRSGCSRRCPAASCRPGQAISGRLRAAARRRDARPHRRGDPPAWATSR